MKTLKIDPKDTRYATDILFEYFSRKGDTQPVREKKVDAIRIANKAFRTALRKERLSKK